MSQAFAVTQTNKAIKIVKKVLIFTTVFFYGLTFIVTYRLLE